MAWKLNELKFSAGLYSNRSIRASKNRWVDGNLVRFRDNVPAQTGGWVASTVGGVPVSGVAREWIAWRMNNQVGRHSAIGTNSNVYRFDGSFLEDITPSPFTAGRVDGILGLGWGAGNYGAGTYGTPRTSTSNIFDAASWTFDMFGETLVGCFSESGQIYQFTYQTDATLVTIPTAPKANAVVVSDERHLFAFGCDDNPRLVKWSDRENYSVWTPLATNRAGSYEMASTSPFKCGARCRGQVLAWTQTELFGFYPLANSLVYSRETLALNAGVMGAHASCVITDAGGEVAVWMGPDSFFIYDGLVRKLPCDLYDYVYTDLNLLQRGKVQAHSNAMFDEIWFYYVSASSTEIDRAVVFNYVNRTWTKALISRTAWLDQRIFPLPLAIDAAGVIYEHENGETANGTAMPSFVLSAPLMIGVGDRNIQVDEFWPDMQAGSADATFTIIGRDYPGGPDLTFGPYNFSITDEKIDFGIETMQVQIKISGAGGWWEIGLPMINTQIGSGR